METLIEPVLLRRNVAARAVPPPRPRIPKIKVLSMGSVGCGKSCLIKRYSEERFVADYIATIGVDYGAITVPLKSAVQARIAFFDLAGHRDFLEVRNEFYKDTQAILLVYDVTSRQSFQELNLWLLEARKYGASLQDCVVMVCGNKADLAQRAVSETEGREWAVSKGYLFFETSAATGLNITQCFEALFEAAIEKLRRSAASGILHTSSNVVATNASRKAK